MLAVLLPLVVAAAVFIAHQWRQQRDAAFARLQDHARALQRAVDREISLDLAVLQTLAQSGEIDRRDWRSFHLIASRTAAVRPESWFVLYDRDRQTIVNTRVPFGVGPLPNFGMLQSTQPEANWRGRKLPIAGGTHDVPFETGKPSFSGLIYSPVLKRPAVGANAPVIREGRTIYGLSLVYGSEFFEKVLQAETAPEVTTAMYDQRGRLIARSRDPERFVGAEAPAQFWKRAATEREGVGETPNVEGVLSVYAFSRSAVNDYVIAAAMPKATVLAPAWRALWLGLAVLVSAGAVGAFFALRLWRRVGTPLIALAQQARSIGDPHGDVASTGIDEVDALQLALQDRSRAEDALRDSEAKLRDADRRKDEFLGMLSHELRNPLAPIRTSTYILQHAAPGSEQTRRAQTVIQRQTEHLTRLVDDLLDVTRIGRGKIELRRERVDLRDVVSRAADDFRLVLRDRGVRFDVLVPDEQLWADADATRITQLVGNLLHNSSKFTRRGDTVALSMLASDGATEIRVRDTGAGIDPDLLPRIFDPFVQGERTLARTDGGLGLGLAVVRGIAELHGGTVRAQSPGKGKGSEFIVRLPSPSPSDAAAPSASHTERRSGGRRVLVVDDNHDAAESLADLVRTLGHSAEVAYDGPSAIEKARQWRPDVVLCDIGLPGMTGYEVAQALRAEHDGALRLVAVTGYAQAEDVEEARAAGFDAHVAKPPDAQSIERLLP